MTIGRFTIRRYKTQCLTGGWHTCRSTYVLSVCTGRTVVSWVRKEAA